MTGPVETEIKLAVQKKEDTERRLHKAGFVIESPRKFEGNTLYDTPDQQLRQNRSLLRLRQAGDQGIVSWKGRPVNVPRKTRPELETTVGSLDALAAIVTQLGFKPVFRYEKFRTEYGRPPDTGVVVLDETPIGTFLELEGPGQWIDATAAELGFSLRDYILDSYARLYVLDCERLGLQPKHMVFSSEEEGCPTPQL